jgi:hypothetical protein
VNPNKNARISRIHELKQVERFRTTDRPYDNAIRSMPHGGF